ncbi:MULTISPECIES: SPFH domain-containing protein [Aneurinibacillus]|jgi:regulator of protease activity HflC (stomatin/prohibitin superfamily)|uniref:Membrane protein n=1 Tax=Aneurinibacillus danicus TaxID=267746 RepID=A0A511VBZ8_9BACL|nr:MULTISPECIES: SPFH domain-containing protein [Aneurinibacillus]GEN34762.1 membrane protein [Aneurinibacillus danicus]
MNEKQAWAINGFIGLLLILALLAGGLYFLVMVQSPILGFLCIFLSVVAASGIFIVQPNQATVLIFFGHYLGSVRRSGLWLGVPFAVRRKVSLKVRNFNSKRLKVNDVDGNPIEIAAVVVFKVIDSAKAMFDVDNYEQFVEIQSETALRYVASRYPYDNFDNEGHSLRGNTDEIASELAQELQSRLAVAGVEVIEARLTHLAYATEIANAMLQRQQASAIVSARARIVEGAVGMVQMAIEELQREGFELDEERKAAMINNLMVAIVSERSAQPVINSGSIY